jgi:hypothetical protein
VGQAKCVFALTVFSVLAPLREIFFGKPEMGPKTLKTFLGSPAKALRRKGKHLENLAST